MKESQHVQYEVSESACSRRVLSRLFERDISIASAVLSEEAVERIPFAMAGGTDPERVCYRADVLKGILTESSGMRTRKLD
jgi:hypothetical protein